MRNSAVQWMFVLLVADCSQLTHNTVWDKHGCCPLECRALAGSDAINTLPNEDSTFKDNSLSYW